VQVQKAFQVQKKKKIGKIFQVPKNKSENIQSLKRKKKKVRKIFQV